ncbi:hypothetical protein Ade02nite_37010 [Paractinoplanes deccanensis]|uniref:Peptide chain release factor 1 n=1 Tax=Paractinoplanes deccanensis TaxID=113561 RepID=A0ABQ3Y5B6_9ACTN|nr:Vms1/Ankzf1 family peptidyl-tRNA hydrolase [Actinoplanes deccanensis]GID75060.1 hypothetical protein Ade02nite_37010 [Actinoplanes deccanensis]
MELTFLRPLFAAPGPWASVYLDASRAEENADREVELRLRALREKLAADGADERTIAAIEDAVASHPTQPGRYGLAVFATGGDVALAETMPVPPDTDLAVWGPLPHAMPLVARRGEEVPYVRVLVGHGGGEITGLDAGGVPRRERVTGGETFPMRKVHAGGWSSLRYHHAVDETWKRNAGDVAKAVTEVADQVGAEVIVVAGDARSVPKLAEQLPKRLRDRVVTTDIAGETDRLDDVTVQAVADVADRHVQDLIDRYRAQQTPSGGLADVVTRLQRGQADTVLLINDESSTDKLWIGPGDPTLVATDERTLRDSGVQDPVQVRADAALLRAIAGTSADLVLIAPGELDLPHGIGAVLRYPDGATAA